VLFALQNLEKNVEAIARKSDFNLKFPDILGNDNQKLVHYAESVEFIQKKP
jgi:hypothetical protein